MGFGEPGPSGFLGACERVPAVGFATGAPAEQALQGAGLFGFAGLRSRSSC